MNAKDVKIKESGFLKDSTIYLIVPVITVGISFLQSIGMQLQRLSLMVLIGLMLIQINYIFVIQELGLR